MRTIFKILVPTAAVLVLFLAFQIKEQGAYQSKDLIIFHAGSLSIPMKETAEKYMQSHPDVKILRESAGSRMCARKISDLKRPCDIIISADYTVIDELLIPEHADWNIKFAGNEMVIAYTAESKRSEEIDSVNWFKILSDESVIYGRSDPDTDPCGYRAVFVIQLAGEFYNQPRLDDILLAKDKNFIRPKEVDLLALLETHDIDYIFIYRSVAVQHGLKFIKLPDEINLKNPDLSGHYKKAGIKVTGKNPGEYIVKTGAPIVYGLTIPGNAPNTETALEFVQFLLEKDKGMEILEKNGQSSLVPSPTGTYDRLPDILKKYALSE